MTTTTETADDVADSRWDAIVIGAGPAGSMAARDVAAGGARVLLVEHRPFPREKVCGGCLNGHALAVLEAAGLETLAERAGGVRLQDVRIGVRGRIARLGLPAGVAVSRARFDAELLGAAIDAGVRFLPRTEARVGAVEGPTRLVHLGRERTVRASVVLAATGLGPSGLPPGSAPRTRVAHGSRIGTACLLADGPSDYGVGTIFMAVGRAGYVGLVRLRDGRLHIAGALEPGAMRDAGGAGAAAATILGEAGFPPVAGLPTAAWQGTPALTRRTHPLADVRMFVLGDAAGYVEPFTGEGIAWALAAGRAIAPLALRAIERWEPRLGRNWDVLHGRTVRRRQAVCRATAAVLRRPWLVRAAFEVLARLPGPAGHLLHHLNAPPHFVEAS